MFVADREHDYFAANPRPGQGAVKSQLSPWEESSTLERAPFQQFISSRRPLQRDEAGRYENRAPDHRGQNPQRVACKLSSDDSSHQASFISEESSYIICRMPFPTRLWFATTINKSKGQSFKNVGTGLGKRSNAWPGFMAVLWVIAVRQLFVISFNPLKTGRNIVYPAVFPRQP